MLTPDDIAALGRVHRSASESFTELASESRLNPATDFRDADFGGLSFRGELLSTFNFTACDFSGADFTGADLRGVTFTQATGLNTANLTGVLTDHTTRWPVNFRPIGTLVLIPPGRFLMGTTKAERRREKVDWADNESPRHEVSLARGFYLGRYPVTVGEFRRFVTETNHPMSGQVYGWNGEKAEFELSERYNWANPGFPQNDLHPVTCVNHDDATAYTEWLTKKTDRHYRLPVEAEWEYACRAGTKTARFWGDNRDDAVKYANGADRSLAVIRKQDPNDRERFFLHDDGYPFTSPVGVFQPNLFGLYDMLGNVWEWCRDHHAENYKNAPKDGTEYTTSDSNASRVLRGGAWDSVPGDLRAGGRVRDDPRDRDTNVGFRVARALPPLES